MHSKTISSTTPGDIFVTGGGELGVRIAEFDWASTPLGPISQWPQSLKTIVRVLVTSRYAMWMSWGPELTFLYNDGYARMTLGKKHPWALGQPSQAVWAEIWPEIGPRIQRVLDTGVATWDEALMLFLERSGYPEETYHTFSYSPLTGDDDKIHGHLCVVTEETERIIGERQIATLRSLAAELGAAMVEVDVLAAIRRGVQTNLKDLPFTLTYLFENGLTRARLACATGIECGHNAAPEIIEVEADAGVWPVRDLLARKAPILVDTLSEAFGTLPIGAWDKAPSRALLVPISRQGQDQFAGILVAALNPYRQLDTSYSGFIDLVAGQIAAGVGNARAYDEERRRAVALAEIDRAKTAFFSNVSHEFRTPLTLILGPTEEALSSPDKSLAGDDLETVHRNELRLLKLVNTLLDFSRIEAGRVEARFRPTDLHTYTKELASVFHSAMEKAGLRYTVESGPIRDHVYVDQDMWEKIVLNLLSNALKSTFDGAITVRLKETDDHAVLVVQDTGTGIAEHEIPHLFERFRRIENARLRTHEGSGIGLALVNELINMHGGTITVKSRLGEGTTFTVSIPFGRKHLPQDRIVESPSTGYTGVAREAFVQEALGWSQDFDDSHAGTGSFSPLPALDLDPSLIPGTDVESVPRARVLLVDDNRDMREYVRRLLNLRFEVTTAGNGREALEKTAAAAPDLVLTDIMMPEMSGIELLAALRSNPATQTTPVILLSARAGEEAKIEGLGRGADDYLVKPFSARELLARVQTHLELARTRKAAAEMLRQSEERFRAIVETTPECVKLVASDGKVLLMNSPGLLMLGATGPDAVIGKSVYTLIAPQDRQRFRKFNESVCHGHKGSLEYDIIGLHGERRHMETHGAPLRDGNGTILHLGVTRDVTDRKRAEEALRRSEKLAAVGRLAATVAHEINNPLESVTNLLYLVKKDPTISSDTLQHLLMADEELDRVAHVARQTLGFYRDTANPTRLNVAKAMDELFGVYGYRLRNREITLIKEMDSEVTIFGSSGEFRQVFSNLILNAIDAMTTNKGKIWVKVRSACDWCDGRRGVRVTMADTGCGIAPEHMPRIFDSFYTTKQDIGTGLGLWLVRNILQKHHGRIHVRSRSQRGKSGTVFTIFWPESSEASIFGAKAS